MTSLGQLSLGWWVAYSVLAAGLSSAFWLCIWCAKQISLEESKPSNSGGEELPLPPIPKEPTAIRIAKMMVLAAVILGAYDLGTKISYSREYAGWQQRNAQYEREHSAYQQAVAAWKAKQKENR